MKSVCLPQFDGPLDLLLSMVRKQELSIVDLPIAEVTRQYMQYLHEARELDIDLGADFAYMAATLIHIKSRSLLPQCGAAGVAEPDPREELVRELLSYEQMKLASEFLRRKLGEESSSWSTNPGIAGYVGEFAEISKDRPDSLPISQVLILAKKALAAARPRESIILEPDTVTVAEMTEWLLSRLEILEPGAVMNANSLFEDQPTQIRRLYLFLAILESTCAQKIRLEQSIPFGTLFVGIRKELQGTLPSCS